MISLQIFNYSYPNQGPLFQDLTLEIGTGKNFGSQPGTAVFDGTIFWHHSIYETAIF